MSDLTNDQKMVSAIYSITRQSHQTREYLLERIAMFLTELDLSAEHRAILRAMRDAVGVQEKQAGEIERICETVLSL